MSCLGLPERQIDGKVLNAGYENRSVMDIAEMVRDVVGSSVGLAVEPTDDLRSYHISSARIEREFGFRPKHTIPIAIENLAKAFADGRVPGAMDDPRYYNIRTMQEAGLK